MDNNEMKDKLRELINSLIKGEDADIEAASSAHHDVLAAKMRNRINPPQEENTPPGDDEVVNAGNINDDINNEE
jgi:hypothetical protein